LKRKDKGRIFLDKKGIRVQNKDHVLLGRNITKGKEESY